MILKSVELENFRLTEKEKIEFSDGTNLLYGKNAEGKTNVLEAIYFFARGKSFRGGKDGDIVRFGQNGYSVKIDFVRNGENETLEYRYYNGERQRLSNGVKVGAKEIIGKFNAVFFCPDHLSIIKNAPSDRREFLNIAISQLSKNYINALSAHKKTVEQKNALLKSETGYDGKLMAAYNEKISSLCAEICIARREYIRKIEKSVRHTVNDISDGKESAEIFYKCDIPAEISRFSDVKSFYVKLLSENEKREQAAKMSLVGIQRDDLEFIINGKDARQFASQGQQRSVALALKIGEGEILCEENGEPPVYLFDDVLGELDNDRKTYILSRTENRQMIVTACERGDYSNRREVNMIEVSRGTYRKT